MLVQLAIRNIVLIDRLELHFAEGLSVLTGETGAGKSILLDAFALALGARGDGSLVRHGEAQGQVTAVFDNGPRDGSTAAKSALSSGRSSPSPGRARRSWRDWAAAARGRSSSGWWSDARRSVK